MKRMLLGLSALGVLFPGVSPAKGWEGLKAIPPGVKSPGGFWLNGRRYLRDRLHLTEELMEILTLNHLNL